MMKQILRVAQQLIVYALLLLLLFYILFPVYWMVISSFQPVSAFGTVEYWPSNPTLRGYQVVAADASFTRALRNTMFVSTVVMGLTLLIGSLGGYAVGRLRFRGRRWVRYLALSMVAFPQIAILGGLYTLFTNPCAVVGASCRQFQLYNTLAAPMLADLILTVPLAVWFLSSYFRQLPREIEDAAHLDGATPLQTFAWVMLPMAAPALVTVGLLTLITVWNEFLFALSFHISPEAALATVAIANYGTMGAGTLFTLAAAVITVTPMIVLVMLFQSRIASGLASFVTARPLVEPEPRAWQKRRWLQPARRAWQPVAATPVAAKVLLATLALGLIVGAAFAWRTIPFPYPLDYGEGPLLDQVQRLAQGENIYRTDLSQPPYTITNYPPLYMLLQTPLALALGPAFWYGRLISLASTLVSAVFVFLLLRELTHQRLVALIGAGLLLTNPFVGYWSVLARIDSLALALSLAALYVIGRWPRARWGVVGCAGLLIAAVYTRQSYGLAAPLASFVWLWWHPDGPLRRQALALAATVAGAGLLIFGLLNFASGGGFFFNIVTANVNAYTLALLGEFALELWTTLPYLIVAGALFLLLGLPRRPRAWRLVAPYLVGATLSGLTIGKIGSNINYWLELCAALAMATAALLAWLQTRPLLRNGVMLLLALQVFLVLPGSRYQLFVNFRIDGDDELAQLFNEVRAADGPVLADEMMGVLPLLERPILLQPFELTQLAEAGVWDQQPLLDALDEQEFAQILILDFPGANLAEERWTPQMLARIESRYERVETLANIEIYEPRK